MNKWIQLIMAMVLALGLTVMTACDDDDDDGGDPADVNGKWTLVDNQQDTATLTLIQNGTTLTGSLSANGVTAPISSGSIRGNDIDLLFTIGTYWLDMDADVNGNTMTGSTRDSEGSTGTFTGTKQ